MPCYFGFEGALRPLCPLQPNEVDILERALAGNGFGVTSAMIGRPMRLHTAADVGRRTGLNDLSAWKGLGLGYPISTKILIMASLLTI